MRWAGGLFLVWAGVLILWLIPGHVSVPSSVESRFLSPRFWPTVVAVATAVVAVLTLLHGFRRPAEDASDTPDGDASGPGATATVGAQPAADASGDVCALEDGGEPDAMSDSVDAGVSLTYRPLRFAGVALLLIGYGWSIEPLGVVAATAAFILLASTLLLRSVPAGVLLWCVLLPVSLAWFFRTFIGVMFPLWPALGG